MNSCLKTPYISRMQQALVKSLPSGFPSFFFCQRMLLSKKRTPNKLLLTLT